MNNAEPPSGAQHEVVYGDLRCVVCEVGATLRSYTRAGVPVLFGFAVEEMATGGRGQVLFPWPNRLEDGRYDFGGVPAQAALDEPSTSCAIHGLVRWSAFELVAKAESQVTLATTLHPQPGYPFRARLELTYSLSGDGLRVSSVMTNSWHRTIPVGLGFHPYLAGRATIDEGAVVLPARTHLRLNERSLPLGVEPADVVRRNGLSFGDATTRPKGRLSGSVLDDCFTDLELDDNKCWAARFYPSPEEGPVVIWADAAFRYLMCFSGDTLAPADRRRGIAIEPMTCPPNALRSGEGLITLTPGESFTCSFGIRLES